MATCEVDLGRFVRVLGNLIKNAREAMSGGGILTLTTDLVQNQVVIRISDTGSGIPADIMPKLFEPFVTHGKSHGTGLGMAIAKSVIDAHGGKISVASIQGNGTTVDFACRPECQQLSPHLRRSARDALLYRHAVPTRDSAVVGFASQFAVCGLRFRNRKSGSRDSDLPRGVTVTQRPLEALFMVRIHAG